jgi:hypothetical protein
MSFGNKEGKCKTSRELGREDHRCEYVKCSGHILSMQTAFNHFLDNVKAEYKQAKKKTP